MIWLLGLYFADDLALLANTQQQMQQRANIVAKHSARLGLSIHRWKSKILKLNSTGAASVTLGEEAKEEIEHFTNPDSVVDTQGWTLKLSSQGKGCLSFFE